MPHGGVRVLPQEPAEPRDALACHHVVGVDQVAKPRPVRDVAADDDRGARLVAPHDLAHELHLAHVRHDGADADDVIGDRADLLLETLEGGEIEERGRRLQVRLDEHEAHERWNMRREKGPCTRVTWLWYSSMGLIARLPCSSSRA